MSKKTSAGKSTEQPGWYIDLDGFQANGRSFNHLVKGYACSRCRSQMKDGDARKAIAKIKDCCSKKEGFFNAKEPLLDSAFRLLLANGNQPLELDELSKELTKKRGDNYAVRSDILMRLLAGARYYGIRHTDRIAQPEIRTLR